MSAIQHFMGYAAAFEAAFKSDDWPPLAPHFTEDAVYVVGFLPPFGGRFEGRDAILAYFKSVLDGFDRRFETRRIGLLEGPREDGDSIWLRGDAVYTAAGVPDIGFELELFVTFRDGRVCDMEDRYDTATIERVQGWVRDHGAKLGIQEG
jgi:ketosteroid isomerase-like protein